MKVFNKNDHGNVLSSKNKWAKPVGERYFQIFESIRNTAEGKIVKIT